MKHTVIELDSEGHERPHRDDDDDDARRGDRASHGHETVSRRAGRRFWGVNRTRAIVVGLVVIPLVALAIYMTTRAAVGETEVTAGSGWRDLTPEQRELKFDEEERRRRVSGRAPMRKLPEDPASGPPTPKPQTGRPAGRPVPARQP